MTNEEKWMQNYLKLKAHVAETGHFCDKHTKLNNGALCGVQHNAPLFPRLCFGKKCPVSKTRAFNS